MARSSEFNDNLITNPDGVFKCGDDVGKVVVNNLNPKNVQENSLNDVSDSQTFDEVAKNTNVEKKTDAPPENSAPKPVVSQSSLVPVAQSTQNLKVALTGLTAISSTIGAVATAVVATALVVGAAVQAAPFLVSLIMGTYDSLTFYIEGGGDDRFVRAVLYGDEEPYYRDVSDDRYVVFSNLREDAVYTLKLEDVETEEVYYEKNFSTPAFTHKNVELSIMELEDENLRFSVSNFTLGIGEFYNVRVTDNSGKELFSANDTEENKKFSLKVDGYFKVKVTVSIAGRNVCFKDVDLEELRTPVYDYSNIEWTWTDDNAASATILDLRKNVKHTFAATVSSETSAADCENAGQTMYTATVTDDNGAEHSDVKTVVIPALGHDYSEHEFVWTEVTSPGAGSDGELNAGYVCSVVFKCGRDNCGHRETVDAVVTEEIREYCDEEGYRDYVASVTFEGNVYSETKRIALPATGHDYSGEPEFVWTLVAEHGSLGGGDEEDPEFEDVPVYAATAVFTCAHDVSHKHEETAEIGYEAAMPWDVEDGWIEYYASVVFDGVEYTDVKRVVLPAPGHAYGEPEFEWTPVYDESGDGPVLSDEPSGYSAEATFYCVNEDCEHSETVTATVVEENTATCAREGEMLYTATAVFEGETYTDYYHGMPTMPEGHDYDEPVFVWTKIVTADAGTETPSYDCYAVFTCKRCGEESDHITAEVSAVLNEQETEIIGFTAVVYSEYEEEYSEYKPLAELPQ